MPTYNDMVRQLGGAPVGLPLYANAKAKTSRPTYYWVDGNNGADGNSGERPDQAFATITAAITKTDGRIDWDDSPWANNDVIVVAPGTYAENITTLPHGCTIYGLGTGGWNGDEENGVKIKPASGSPLAGTWVNGAMYNVCLESPDTTAAYAAVTLNKVHFENVRFCGLPGASPTTTDGLSISTGSSNCNFIECYFTDVVDGIHSSGAFVGERVKDCLIQASTVGIHLTNGQLASYTHIDGCTICSAGNTALATGIEANNCNPKISNTFITATDPISGTVKCNGAVYGNNVLLSAGGA